MIKNLFKKQKKENQNDDYIPIIALLVHAAKIDEKYTDIEKQIIKKALLYLENVKGSILPCITNICSSRDLVALALECEPSEIMSKISGAINTFLLSEFSFSFLLKIFLNIYLNLNSDNFSKGLFLSTSLNFLLFICLGL